MCNGDAIYADNAIDSVATQPWISGREHIAAEGMGSATDLDGFRARYQYHYDDPKLSAFYARVPAMASSTAASTWHSSDPRVPVNHSTAMSAPPPLSTTDTW